MPRGGTLRSGRNQPFGQVPQRRNDIGNLCLANLRLAAYDSLGHRCLGSQERVGDLLGRQSADLAKRQRHLQLWVNGGMTTGDFQTPALCSPTPTAPRIHVPQPRRVRLNGGRQIARFPCSTNCSDLVSSAVVSDGTRLKERAHVRGMGHGAIKSLASTVGTSRYDLLSRQRATVSRHSARERCERWMSGSRKKSLVLHFFARSCQTRARIAD